jgi:hypothetical protein
MSVDKDFSFKWGAITLLDFLGWKGVWMNDYKKHSQMSPTESNYSSLEALDKLIMTADEICNKKCDALGCKPEYISISDTVAIFTPCKEEEYYTHLKLHADICSEFMDAAAKIGFALRGAITIGEYATLKNIFVGPGVDECASWYEQTDWIGVIFAPSAQFIIERIEQKEQKKKEEQEENFIWRDDNIIHYKGIPLKKGVKCLKYCVAWGDDSEILNKMLENTVSLPIDVAIKYINTNEFLYETRQSKKKGN